MEENTNVEGRAVNHNKNRHFCKKCNMPLTGFDLKYGKNIKSQSGSFNFTYYIKILLLRNFESVYLCV